jgi:hypothetical protein
MNLVNLAMKGVFPWWFIPSGRRLSEEKRSTRQPRATQSLEDMYRGLHDGTGKVSTLHEIIKDIDRRLVEMEARQK